MAGKGDGRRPSAVPKKEFDSNWDRIFGGGEKGKVGEEERQGAPTRNAGSTPASSIETDE